jgi:hypothetical protein
MDCLLLVSIIMPLVPSQTQLLVIQPKLPDPSAAWLELGESVATNKNSRK